MNTIAGTTRPRVESTGRMLRIVAPGGDVAEVPLTWLRDRCECPSCRHPSGQRLLDPATIPAGLEAIEIGVDSGLLRLTWMPGGHRSEYALDDLVTPPPAPDAAYLWDARAEAELVAADHPRISASDEDGRDELLRWLRGVQRMGCGVLHRVPVEDGEVARVAELFGHVRATNYGRWFDVRSTIAPDNLANTSLGLPAHTDNPYRDPVPTMQLLHCLESSASGGDNVLVDGWRVAAEVRAQQPDGFDLLVRRSVTFAYRDGTAELSTRAPLIELDGDGEPRRVRFNARSMQPASLHPSSMPTGDLARWYDAYLLFARLLADPHFQIRLRLDPGDLFVVDNRRVLHGRTAYAATSGSRHLQGCYADVDGLHSTIAVLSRPRTQEPAR